MKYKKGAIQSKGFGKADKKLAERVRAESILLILGYTRWIDFGDVEPDTLNFVQKFWEEGNLLLDTLAEGDIWTARNLLEEGPWDYNDLGTLVKGLDDWALALSDEREAIGPMPLDEVRKTLNHGLEVYHDALLERHAESARAEATLTEAMEKVGYTLFDTGAVYTRDGKQDGPRDACYEREGAPDILCKVYHGPMRVEWVTEGEGEVPVAVSETLLQWEGAK